MKVNELRIGNWINDNGYNSIIGVIDSHYHAIQISGSPRMIALETIEPIPLTEEWLLRFGKIEWLSRDIDGGFVWFNGKKIYIKFVHSLQNMYFCIEQKELIWKDI